MPLSYFLTGPGSYDETEPMAFSEIASMLWRADFYGDLSDLSVIDSEGGDCTADMLDLICARTWAEGYTPQHIERALGCRHYAVDRMAA